jgi:hypothetical protein
MTSEVTYSHGWLEPAPATVFACLLPGELRIEFLHVDGNPYAVFGTHRDVSIGMVPSDLRMPNTSLWVQFNGKGDIIRVWRRET